MSCSRPQQLTPQESRLRTFTVFHREMLTICLLVAGLIALPHVALAQKWVLSPLVEISALHIDNPRLKENDATENITGGLLIVGGELQRKPETSRVLIGPTAVVYRYSGNNNENSESLLLNFDAENNGQRSNWRLRGNFRQQEV